MWSMWSVVLSAVVSVCSQIIPEPTRPVDLWNPFGPPSTPRPKNQVIGPPKEFRFCSVSVYASVRTNSEGCVVLKCLGTVVSYYTQLSGSSEGGGGRCE